MASRSRTCVAACVALALAVISVASPASTKPRDVEASDGVYADRIVITWDAVSGALRYDVYRSEPPSHAETKVGYATAPSRKYVDQDVSPCRVYEYYVQPILSDAYGTPSDSDTGYAGSSKTAPVAPENATASVDHVGEIVLAWSAVEGAASYDVYRSTTGQTGTYAPIVTVTAAEYTDPMSSSSCSQLYYQVRACSPDCGCSDFSGPVLGSSQATLPEVPADVSASSGTYADRVSISWSPSPGASSYEIWRGAHGSSAPSAKLDAVAATTYVDKTAVAGMTYIYWVRAGNCTGTSAFGAPATGRTGYALNVFVQQQGYGGALQPAIHAEVLGMLGGTLRKAYTDDSGVATLVMPTSEPTSVTVVSPGCSPFTALASPGGAVVQAILRCPLGNSCAPSDQAPCYHGVANSQLLLASLAQSEAMPSVLGPWVSALDWAAITSKLSQPPSPQGQLASAAFPSGTAVTCWVFPEPWTCDTACTYYAFGAVWDPSGVNDLVERLSSLATSTVFSFYFAAGAGTSDRLVIMLCSP